MDRVPTAHRPGSFPVSRFSFTPSRAITGAMFLLSALAMSAFAIGCSAADGKTAERAGSSSPRLSVTPVAAVEKPVARFVRATGTLMAEEEAEVAAETAGRVVATPIERGTAVAQGTELVRLSSTET